MPRKPTPLKSMPEKKPKKNQPVVKMDQIFALWGDTNGYYQPHSHASYMPVAMPQYAPLPYRLSEYPGQEDTIKEEARVAKEQEQLLTPQLPSHNRLMQIQNANHAQLQAYPYDFAQERITTQPLYAPSYILCKECQDKFGLPSNSSQDAEHDADWTAFLESFINEPVDTNSQLNVPVQSSPANAITTQWEQIEREPLSPQLTDPNDNVLSSFYPSRPW